MAARLVGAGLAVIASLTAASITVGVTISAYSASATTATNTFTSAADWTPPSAAAAAIGRTTAYDTGFIEKSAAYYVYANVSDTGHPASGMASVKVNVNSLTTGQTAVSLSAGTYSAGGSAYNYRSAALSAGSSLNTGTYTFTLSSTDGAGNAASQDFTTTRRQLGAHRVRRQSTNTAGGTAGRLEPGDKLTLTYSQPIDTYSLLSGWSGDATNVQIALVDGGGSSDYLLVYTTDSTPDQIPVGTVYLNTTGYLQTGSGSYIVFGATGAVIPSTMTRSGSAVILTLGTASGSSKTSTTAATMTWSPSTSATDIAGNAVGSSSANQSGTRHVNF